ncbi:hypothetical protein [Paraburkholderia bryophila]|uniref:Uncharacterized protein n=1 Tax=Paraburkholderia bryophila TaxID=420952 RepID=A0A7Y9WPD7_9BURK|nr:hypothetical protein [Paraburkholderia bryophila]NYH24659.1 hypothetical protein [Paraburkholderia bryophila]
MSEQAFWNGLIFGSCIGGLIGGLSVVAAQLLRRVLRRSPRDEVDWFDL